MADDKRGLHVKFSRVQVEDRAATIKSGVFTAVDEDAITITVAGATDSLTHLKRDKPELFLVKFRPEYEAWLKGEEPPLTGTSVRNWPAISPAQCEVLWRAGIKTIEDLATLPQTAVQALGMGGLNLQKMAQAWMESGQDRGALASQNAALKAQIEQQAQQLAEMQAAIDRLRDQLDGGGRRTKAA